MKFNRFIFLTSLTINIIFPILSIKVFSKIKAETELTVNDLNITYSNRHLVN